MSKDLKSRVEKNFKTLSYFVIAFCLAVHIALFVLFFIKDFTVLYYLNLLSIAIFSACYLVVRKNMLRLFTLFVFFEISVNMLLTSILLGWNSGFYFYCIALLPFAFQFTFLRNKTRLALAITESLFFFATLLLTVIISPKYIISENSQTIFHAVNASLCLTAHVFVLYYFISTTKTENIVLKSKNNTLRTLANTDPLTGAFNRRYFMKKINECFEKYLFDGIDFSILMLDIDDFKKINDNHGHEGGDLFLKHTVSTILQTLRKDDIICRWGGEEILILLPQTSGAAALSVGEKIRVLIENLAVPFNNSEIFTTVTVGVNSCIESTDLDDLINTADRRLYIGKAKGKNCVVSNG